MEISILPKWLIKKLSKDIVIQNELNILISSLFIFFIFLILKQNVIELLNYVPHFCLFKKIVNIDCPFCGTTRAFCELANCNYKQALKLNFSSLFIALFLLFQIPLRIVGLCNKLSIEKINLISNYSGKVVFFIIIINWLLNFTFF
jgi:hypothetical protein